MAYQAKIKAVIISNGESVTFYPQLETYSEDTGWTSANTGSTSGNCIPYDYFKGNLNFQDYGNLKQGDLKLIAVGDITLSGKEKFTYKTKTYQLTSVNPLPFRGENLGYVLTASELID